MVWGLAGLGLWGSAFMDFGGLGMEGVGSPGFLD